MSAPRVLHVAQPVDGGVGSYVAGAAAAQALRGWQVAVACPSTGLLPDAVRRAGLTVLPWEAQRQPGPRVASEVVQLSSSIGRFRPQLVHLHSAKAGLAGRLAVRGRIPTLFQPHGWSWLAVTGPLAAASRSWEVWGQRWTTTTVCVSEGEATAGNAAGLSGPTVVVRNGVRVDRFAGAPSRTDARERLGLRAEGPVVVCVGRLCRQKGQDRLIRAWARVSPAVPTATLLLVGGGPDEAALRAADAAGVVLLGPRDDVPLLLAAADVVALPSRWEGLSLALLEALAAERSVLTTATAGSEVLPAGCGVVLAADPLDDDAVVDQLVQELRARLDDPARAAAEGMLGGQQARARFDVAATWTDLEALVRRSMG